MAERERSQLQSKLAMVYVYTMVLTGELWEARIPILSPPQIPGQWAHHSSTRARVYASSSWPVERLLRLRGLPRIQGTLPALLAVRVLPSAILQAKMMMMMMIQTSLSRVMILR